MEFPPDNPKSNVLPDGVSEDALLEAVRKSGYPLQVVVASELSRHFHITEEWGYTDRNNQEHRALDICAFTRVGDQTKTIALGLTLLVECKRSSLPYIFFLPGAPRSPYAFPTLVGFAREHFEVLTPARRRYVEPAEFMCLGDFPFASEGPPLSVSFTRAERKGKGFDLSGEVPFNSIVLPLASAKAHLFAARRAGASDTKFFPSIAICICVIDAPMLVGSGTPEDPKLVLHPWVRLLRQEAASKRHRSAEHHVIECVHRDFLLTYVEKHLLPFATEVSARILSKEEIVFRGAASVPDTSEWTWGELAAAPR